ncbi:MAG: hypothetical protein IKG46_02505 [Solobacterium sp.]|nr:hypothetical protein [Solobacterium sp.]
MTRVKIRIRDDTAARDRLDAEYEASSQIRMCRYALQLANHIFQLIDYPETENEMIREAFHVNELWQSGNARMHDVRKAAFRIHQAAKECSDGITAAALRTAGHAAASAHMKEHAMVASDYAVRVINLLYPDDMDAVRKEREWQLTALKSIPDETDTKQ